MPALEIPVLFEYRLDVEHKGDRTSNTEWTQSYDHCVESYKALEEVAKASPSPETEIDSACIRKRIVIAQPSERLFP